MILTTGRIRDQWHTRTKTGKVRKLNQHIAQPFLEIHPHDAQSRHIHEGDVVVVSGARGTVRVHARLTDSIKEGVVFLPMHWGKILQRNFGRANNLTNSQYDPVSKEPDFKFSAVEVTKFTKAREKVIVVGAGAAAYRFIHTYRSLNQEDEIHVFSQEKYPFYDRVLLPEYVNNQLAWQDLAKFKNEQALDELNVQLHPANAIKTIDRDRKTVTDSVGRQHSYDRLLLATGSRAFVPSDVPVHLPGIFTMRNRENADRLKAYLPSEQAEVIIVGGGLLGLELAAALREMGVAITIVQLSSRLMQRQLDTTASAMLRERVEAMGIDLYTNDQVQLVETHEAGQPIAVRLRSGAALQCHAVVYAVGTRPTIELAQQAGLGCGRGIQVNEYLQSSDPAILAVGEIAEFQERLMGTTAAAEQQADIAARFLIGDLLSYYQGSVLMNILKFSRLDLCSVGLPDIPTDRAEDYEEITFLDRTRSYYKKCIIHQDRLVGAILMGDKNEFAEFKGLIESSIELGEKREQLLRSGSTRPAVKGPIVCSCGNVGKGNLTDAIQGGCRELRSLCETTGAGLGCGSCKPEMQVLLDESAAVRV